MIFSKKNVRRHERFFPKSNAYIVFSPGFTRRGPLINISRGGLTCLYFMDKAIRIRQLDRFVNIRCGAFTMGDIPYRIISDEQLTDDQHGGHRIIRKRSVEFTKLSPAQESRIEYFIANYTKRSLTDYRSDMTEGMKLPFH